MGSRDVGWVLAGKLVGCTGLEGFGIFIRVISRFRILDRTSNP